MSELTKVVLQAAGREISLDSFIGAVEHEHVVTLRVDGKQVCNVHVKDEVPTVLMATGPDYTGNKFFVRKVMHEGETFEIVDGSSVKFLHILLEAGKKPLPPKEVAE